MSAALLRGLARDPIEMSEPSFEDVARRVVADGRWPLEAYEFLQQGLALTAARLHGDAAAGASRHVSGQQLCEGLRDYALHRWGPLARETLRRWRIQKTRDFGEMVYVLIGAGWFGKQESDRIEDFDDVYDFDAAFAEYQIPLDAFDAETARSAGR